MGAVYLTTDDVIAATRDTMEDTIHYIIDKYGSAAKYLHEVTGNACLIFFAYSGKSCCSPTSDSI